MPALTLPQIVIYVFILIFLFSQFQKPALLFGVQCTNICDYNEKFSFYKLNLKKIISGWVVGRGGEEGERRKKGNEGKC